MDTFKDVRGLWHNIYSERAGTRRFEYQWAFCQCRGAGDGGPLSPVVSFRVWVDASPPSAPL